MQLQLLPDRSWYAPDVPVTIDIATDDGADRDLTASAALVVSHWGDEVDRVAVEKIAPIRVGCLAPGGYRVALVAPDGIELAVTAVEVRAVGARRLRYGFVADFRPGRTGAEITRMIRRHHLTGIQFYDWAYRHADLVGGGRDYTDPLDQPISLDTVQELIRSVGAAGAVALGYAAVYAVGNDEWSHWQHDALLDAAEQPFALGDFLRIVDPAAPDWLEHFCCDVVAAAALGFDGFHLDQYGYPKVAQRADGAAVDVAESFVELIGQVRERLPESTLVFNNVNDFGTDQTKGAPQDAIYIEPWAPNTTLSGLARLVENARRGSDLPIVLAAYQAVYTATDDVEAADRATALTMATLFAHGATQLLIGEEDRMLVDPYYVRNQTMAPSTRELVGRWYDFVVEHDELLLDPAIRDVTAQTAGEYNDDLVVTSPTATVTTDAVAGAVWQRNTTVGSRWIVHLINLIGQSDIEWDEPRAAHTEASGLLLQVRAVAGAVPRIRVADPDADGRLTDLDVELDGTHATVRLPALHAWQLILVELDGQRR